jgi:putative DNA primase/helicase
MALSGALLAAGHDAGETDRLVVAVAHAAGDEESPKRGKAAATAAKMKAAEPITGLPRAVELLGLPADCVGTFRKWLGLGGNEGLLLDPRDPLRSAQEFLAEQYTSSERITLLRHHAEFLAYDGSRYAGLEDATVRAELYRFLEKAQIVTAKGSQCKYEPFRPDKHKVAQVLEAVEALTHARADRLVPPCWLEGKGPAPGEIVTCRNGLLHVPTGELEPATPRFFGRNALAFDYDPAAAPPARWLAFLADLWPGKDEADQMSTLQEVFGYALVPDTRQQKAFLVVGPKRSGKGTIARVLARLVGERNVVGPTLSSLGTNFGLEPLIGKLLAVISDARLGHRTDPAIVAERLLSISGEDTLTVDRKYRPAWTGKLTVRFLVLTNELPRLADASGALASRFVILRTTRTFYGRESPALFDGLAAELPGILLWALAGWKRLHERGHFVQPQSSAAAARHLEDLASPVSAFLRDRCLLVPDLLVPKADLYAAWRRWGEEQGRGWHCDAATFGRDLFAACPDVGESQPRIEGQRVRCYTGVALREHGQECEADEEDLPF